MIGIFIRFIGTHAEFDKVDAELNSPDGNEVKIFALLVEKYEDKHYPIEGIRN